MLNLLVVSLICMVAIDCMLISRRTVVAGLSLWAMVSSAQLPQRDCTVLKTIKHPIALKNHKAYATM